jgi:DNA-binding response OmpR family regulator
MLMQHQLKKAGYVVKLVRNGKAAVDELDKENFGLILSDINMPTMNGFELCKEVKSRENCKGTTFVLLATPIGKHEILRMLECGADNFILKAYDERTFIAKLDEIVNTRRLRQESGSATKAAFAGLEIDLQTSPAPIADFMISAYEMYLFQLTKSSAQDSS